MSQVVLDNLIGLGIVAGIALFAAVLAWAFALLLERALHRRSIDGMVQCKLVRRPWVLTLSAVLAHSSRAFAFDWLSDGVMEVVSHALVVVAIIGLGWLVIRLTDALGTLYASQWDLTKDDNRKERAMLTKFRVLRRVWFGLVCLLTVGAVLFSFPSIRSLGAGLLASAGVAGIVLGIALRPTLETFLASLQVAITEPISIDDVVIVENEWGRIEEIRPTYVVVRIWDDRRLIVPLTYFINQPFQNWTRTQSQITAAVLLKLDYTTPIQALREMAGQIIQADENYDGRFWNVQVTDADDRTMTVRVLCSAADASKAWALRCAVREQLITWLQQTYPQALPRLRSDVQHRGGGSESS